MTARRGKNTSEPIILELRTWRHALGAFRPGEIARVAFAVLNAKFLLIDEIEGGDLARYDLSDAATSAAFGRLMGDLMGEQVRRVIFQVNSRLC